MQVHVTSGGMSDSAFVVREQPQIEEKAASFWWLYLVFGIAWIIASLVVLQFDGASVATVGLIVGVMFSVAAAQQFVLMAIAESMRWLWGIFGVLFAIAAIICFISPQNTFVALADTLGFLFLCVGIWWMIRAFVLKAATSAWWLDLVAGMMMVVLAFWTSGQFFFEKAYTLLVFAGIWALMHGVTDIVGAFRIRNAR
jgi:uncharacterized membrane protein HdeD (DUF308 family)